MNLNSYINNIPQNTPLRMVYAACGAFMVETIFSGKPSNGAIAAALSALATAIHGLVTPLFISLLGRYQLSWDEEMCRTFTGIIGAGCIAKALGNNSIMDKLLFLSVIQGYIIHINPARRDLRSTESIVIFPKF